MEDLTVLFHGAARPFQNPSGVAALLAEVLGDCPAGAEICATGAVRLRAAELTGQNTDAAPVLFDHLVLTPSYGRIEGNQWQENPVIRAGLNRLRPGGTCICVVSNGWLSRLSPDDVATRRLLVEEYCVTRVVLLPPHIFDTEAKACAFFLEKSPPQENNAILITDLRAAGVGPALLTALCGAGEEGPRLTLDMLRAHDYMMIPEAYEPPARGDAPAGALREVEQRLSRLYREAEHGAWRAEQFSLFAPEPAAPVRDPELVARLLDLEYQRLDLLFEAYLREIDCPKEVGRKLFTLKNGLDCREEIRREGYPFYTAAGLSGFVRSANVTNFLPTLVISRVGAYCGQVYKAWEKCLVSANAMYLSSVEAGVLLDFLLLLLRGACLNHRKRGSAQPYITQDVVLDQQFPVPPEAAQAVFLASVAEDLRRVKALEQEQLAGWRR